jgi:hypothetical protein
LAVISFAEELEAGLNVLWDLMIQPGEELGVIHERDFTLSMEMSLFAMPSHRLEQWAARRELAETFQNDEDLRGLTRASGSSVRDGGDRAMPMLISLILFQCHALLK